MFKNLLLKLKLFFIKIGWIKTKIQVPVDLEHQGVWIPDWVNDPAVGGIAEHSKSIAFQFVKELQQSLPRMTVAEKREIIAEGIRKNQEEMHRIAMERIWYPDVYLEQQRQQFYRTIQGFEERMRLTEPNYSLADQMAQKAAKAAKFLADKESLKYYADTCIANDYVLGFLTGPLATF